MTVLHDGKPVDIVAQAGKTGFLYVFNRVTGEPLWPIEERSVPRSDMPGEETWPTQPFPTAPKPFARQSFTEKDLNPFIEDPAERARFLEDIRGARNEGLFTPPGTRNTIQMPGNNGGANFGGTAIDPEHGTMFVVSKDFPAMLKLTLPEAATSAPPAGSSGGNGDGAAPAAAAAPASADPASLRYKSPFGFMITSSGLSAIGPPWTTLTAYDLNTGAIKWQVPLGDVPELAAKGITGTGGHFPKVGPVVTAGGLLFTGTRDRKIRAFDVDTGKELWSVEVNAAIEGIPAVYEVDGRQFIVYCAAAQATTHTHASPGHPASTAPIPGAYVALALPGRPDSEGS
jgi:glucose dehydrogenase